MPKEFTLSDKMEESVCVWGSVSVCEWYVVHIWCVGGCGVGDSANVVCCIYEGIVYFMYLTVCVPICATWCVWGECVWCVSVCDVCGVCVCV